MTDKPKITVAPDDDESGFNALRLDWEDGFAEHAGAHHYDTTIDAGVYYAIERIAELEAERDKLRISLSSTEACLVSLEQTYEALSVDARSIRDERDQLRAQNSALACQIQSAKEMYLTYQSGEYSWEDSPDDMYEKLQGDPDLLARIRAEAKAEAYDNAAMQLSIKHGPEIRRIRELAADERKQAEGE